jgi:hypothetical protein
MKTTQLSILLTVAFLFTAPIHRQHHHGEIMKKEKQIHEIEHYSLASGTYLSYFC